MLYDNYGSLYGEFVQYKISSSHVMLYIFLLSLAETQKEPLLSAAIFSAKSCG